MFKKSNNYIIKEPNKNFMHKLFRIINNKKYITSESKNPFFDDINGYKLDCVQRKCILTEEKATLIVAGAGSGKSLTIVGKIRYLLDVKKIEPTKILCISFTNEATLSLKKKLDNELLDIKTFHKLGLDILKNNGYQFEICKDNILDKIIDNYFENDLNYQTRLIEKIIKYLGFYLQISKNYQTGDDIYDIICNYLALNQIRYQVNEYINLIDYNINIKIKDQKDCDINISYDAYKNNTLIEVLHEELVKHNVFINPDFKKIKDYNNIEFLKIKKIIKVFINLFKSNNLKIHDLEKIKIEISNEINSKQKNRNIILIEIIENIIKKYQNYLFKNNLMDFDDLINKAKDVIKDGNIPNYEYIIIDEYQDTSITKYQLIKEIINKTNAKLLVVGDDFQSIYRFTGCNLDIFTNFKNYYPDSEIIKIERTYRNSQQLIDVAGKFIMKNKNQIVKYLTSDKKLKNPIKIKYYDNFIYSFKEIVNQIDGEILILGRNNKDINLFIDDEIDIVEGEFIIYQNRQFRFLTVHKSKGLEEANVILINVNGSITGFPNKMIEDPLLKYLNPYKEYYPYEEERRLFYVALTRTKNEVYILVPIKNPSIFINEIVKEKNVQIIE